jgi:hypothetical protein
VATETKDQQRRHSPGRVTTSPCSSTQPPCGHLYLRCLTVDGALLSSWEVTRARPSRPPHDQGRELYRLQARGTFLRLNFLPRLSDTYTILQNVLLSTSRQTCRPHYVQRGYRHQCDWDVIPKVRCTLCYPHALVSLPLSM